MLSILMSLILALQMMLSGTAPAFQPEHDRPFTPVQVQPQAEKLWWGMLDPELSTWFAHIPADGQDEAHPILWNWSWRGFLAALFEKPMLKEAVTNAPSI